MKIPAAKTTHFHWPSPTKISRRRKLARAIITGLIVVGLLIFAQSIAMKGRKGNLASFTVQDPLVQGWTSDDRQIFYHTSQGTRVFPYSWFMALEEAVPFSRKPFLNDERIRRFRLIPDPVSTSNPDGLPVGLVKDVSPDGEFISVTCAACHTGQLSFNGTLMRIDGGPAMHSLSSFFTSAYTALADTYANPLKFRRFATKVLGDNSTLADRFRLHGELRRSIVANGSKLVRAKLKHLYPTAEGLGRLDALGRGGNLILGEEIDDERNFVVANAPVSYPHLWGTPFFDWVQWNGSIQQPMARNIAEALGVNTPVTLKTRDSTKLFESPVKLENLHLLETKLQKLKPPVWPEELLGPIDRDKANRGAELYTKHCADCHESKEVFFSSNRLLRINMYPLDVIGTDQTTAVNFNKRIARTGQLALPPVNLPQMLPVAGALQAVTSEVARRKYAELQITPEMQNEMNGRRANLVRSLLMYRARNMDGIWATAPYLHNNSVPTLYQLLLPASQRDRKFYVGNLQYDPRTLGFVTSKSEDSFEFVTSVTGNSNAGHEFRDAPLGQGVIGPLLTEEERWAIIEYLKTR